MTPSPQSVTLPISSSVKKRLGLMIQISMLVFVLGPGQVDRRSYCYRVQGLF